MGTTSAPGTSLAPSPCSGTQGWAWAVSAQFNSIQNNTFYPLSTHRSQKQCYALGTQAEQKRLKFLPSGNFQSSAGEVGKGAFTNFLMRTMTGCSKGPVHSGGDWTKARSQGLFREQQTELCSEG